MPAAAWIAPAVATLGGAAIGAKSSSSANRARERSERESLQFAREQEAQRRKEYETERARQVAQDEALKRAWEAEQARRAPYRSVAETILRGIGGRYGINVPSSSSFYSSPTPPPGWVPGQQAPVAASSGRLPVSSLFAAPLGQVGGEPYTRPLEAPRLTLADLYGRGM